MACFFRFSDVISKLEDKGEMLSGYPTDEAIETWLKAPLVCNQCHQEAPNIPKLKNHLASHLK